MKSKKSIIALISFIVLVVGVITASIISGIIDDNNKKEIPDVIGKDEITATELLNEAGFTSEVVYVFSKKVDKGKVAKLASLYEESHIEFIGSGKYNCKKLVYVLVSKGPSGYKCKKYDSKISYYETGMSALYSPFVKVDFEHNEYYISLSFTEMIPRAIFSSEGQASFESNTTEKMYCKYTYNYSLSNGKTSLRLDLPQEAFSDSLPSNFKYIVYCTVNDKSNSLTIEYKNIVWEKEGPDYI